MKQTIHVVIGSTRQGRLADGVVDWLKSQLAGAKDISLEVIDLKEEALPFFVSEVSPAYAPDTSPKGAAWSQKIAAANKFIFVTPEYNRGYPAALKNALDFLYKEWHGKPALIVSYGYVDGGLSANNQLRPVLEWLKMPVLEETLTIQLDRDTVVDGKLRNTAQTLAEYEQPLKKAVQKLADM